MVDETRSDSTTADTPFAPLGEVLSAARKAKKLTQHDVSNSLRISVKQVDAIENNAFDLLPESATTRGFIRNYARFLGVDVEPLLASHRQRVPSDEPASLSVKTTTRHNLTEVKKQRAWLKYLLAGLLLLLAAWYFVAELLPSLSQSTTEMQASSESMPLPEEALPAAERRINTEVENTSTVTQSATLPDASQSAAKVAQTPLTDQLNASGSQVLDATVGVSATTTASPAPSVVEQNIATQHKVSMTFTENTWVSIKNAAGRVVLQKEFLAGDTGGYDGEPPLQITIGNAKATQLYYLGQPIDLAASTKGNVARVKLR